jgi:uncharacterized protein YqjF (DUF2071 family)
MTTTLPITESLSAAARERLVSSEGGPFMVNDWLRTVVVHFEADPGALAAQVPFELDLRDGSAYVSLVAFTMERLRLSVGGRLLAWATAPVSRHEFLNLRTYVRRAGEPGIYFLAEWLPNHLSVILGPRTFGLPYRLGRLRYEHAPETGTLRGRVESAAGADSGSAFAYEGELREGEHRAAEPGSLDEFLMERYTAFTLQRETQRRFRVWHEPWPLAPADIRVTDASLLAASGAWVAGARQVAAHHSPGVEGVWIGRPHCIAGPACARRWDDGKAVLPPRPSRRNPP